MLVQLVVVVVFFSSHPTLLCSIIDFVVNIN